MSDARQSPRSPGVVPVKLSFAGVETFLSAYTENVSLGGVFIRTNDLAPVGTRLDLTIELSPGKGLRTVGEVAWVRAATPEEPAGVGVRFVEMAPAHKQWLDAAVKGFVAKALAAKAVEAKPAEAKPATASPAAAKPAAASLELDMASEPAPARAGLQHVSSEKRAEYLDLEFEEAGGVVGIDLGTSNSAACVVVDGKPVIIDLGDPEVPGTAGNRTLPSVVAYDDQGRVTLGGRAIQDLAKNPKRTVFGAKRFIGRTYDSPAVQSMLGRFPYRVVPDTQGKVAIEINGHPTALTSVSAHILRAIREKCNAQLRRNIDRAIITVPAYYNDNQRAAVVHAGTLAGFTVERILNEPTAAAVAYGISEGEPRRILVYDLGGGTFDVSIMQVQPGFLQVLATAGDTFLGGEDFDAAIVQHVLVEYAKSSGKQLSQNHAALAIIKDAAEKAKKRLSTNDKAMVTVREAFLRDNSKVRLEVEVCRQTVEKLAEPLIVRSFSICDLALSEAKMTIADLAEVLLVGGQTRMPYVRQRVRDYFKREPRSELNPDEVVALGAGLLPHLAHQRQLQFQDVLPMSIGLAAGSRFKPLIERNTPVPCSKSFKLNIPKARFASTVLELWQGDSVELHQNEKLGTLRADVVEAGPEDPVPIVIQLSLSADCLLEVQVKNTATHQCQIVILQSEDVA